MRLVLLASVCVMEVGWLMVGAASPRLTESPQFTDAMFGALPPIWGWADALRRTQTAESAAKLVFVAGLVLVCMAYGTSAITLARSNLKRPYVWIAAGTAVFSLTLAASAGLLSTDAVMYAVYGRMAAVYGLNPYLFAPTSVADNQLLEWAGRAQSYATVASVYGPLWTWLSAALAALTAHAGPLAQVLPYRGVGLLSHAANTYLVWRLARRLASDTRSPFFAAAVYAWNPLVLFELVASGHNDGFMLSLVLSGLLLAFSARRQLAGAALVWAGALVKWVPAVLLLYVVCAATASVQGWSARARWLGVLGGLLALLTLASFGRWLDVRDIAALRTSTAAGSERFVNAPLDVPTAWLAAHLVDRTGADVAASQAVVRQWTFGAARLLFLAYVIVEAIRLWKTRATLHAVLEASVRTLLVTLLLGLSQVLTWYLTWPLALAAPLGLRNRLTQVAVAYSALYLPVFYAIHEDMLPTPVGSTLVVLVAILPLLVAQFVGRARPVVAPKVERVATA